MNRCFFPMSRILAAVLVTASCTTVSLAQTDPKGPPGGLGVNVVNTPLPVTVTNPTIPPSTVNVGNPAALAAANAQALRGTPVSLRLTVTSNVTPYIVPVGKLLVMEYASGTCPQPNVVARVQVTTGGFETFHAFGFQGFQAGGQQFGQFGQLVKIYADPETKVFLLGLLECDVFISGQLITP